LVDTHPPEIFVLVHYFGLSGNATSAADFCRRNKCWLVEDAAHVLKPFADVGKHGDLVLYSLHKHLPLPDGALMLARPDGSALGAFADVAVASVVTSVVASIQRETRSSEMDAFVWMCKRCMQKLGFFRGARLPSSFLNDATNPRLTGPAMSAIARRMLSRIGADLAWVSRTRVRNAAVWRALLGNAGVQPAPESRTHGGCPFMAAFAAADLQATEAVYGDLQRRGLPVSTWPDLPPEVRTDREHHGTAIGLRETRFYFPVHQDLRIATVAFQAPTLESGGELLRLSWFSGTENEWDGLLAQTQRSNLLQSWTYGLGKSQAEGWEVKRAVIAKDGRPVAVFQALRKSLGLLLSVWRINRGPLFFDHVTPAETAAAIRLIGSLGCIWRRSLLLVAFELESSGGMSILLEQSGYVERRARPYVTVWMDLRRPISDIREKLGGKWRNQLRLAEKSGLEVEVSAEGPEFQWMIDRHSEAVESKRFTAIHPKVLRVLRDAAPADRKPLIFRANLERTPVSGICVTLHGNSATYLLGWNAVDGRVRNANQLLLWHAVLWLHNQSYPWFDLGGIDEEGLPGVAAFKLGTNGIRCESSGEYIKWL
jgi:hypothetical protein